MVGAGGARGKGQSIGGFYRMPPSVLTDWPPSGPLIFRRKYLIFTDHSAKEPFVA